MPSFTVKDGLLTVHQAPKQTRPPQGAPKAPRPKGDKKAGMFVPRKR